MPNTALAARRHRRSGTAQLRAQLAALHDKLEAALHREKALRLELAAAHREILLLGADLERERAEGGDGR